MINKLDIMGNVMEELFFVNKVKRGEETLVFELVKSAWSKLCSTNIY